MAHSPSLLAHNMKLLERLLMEHWHLRIKPASAQMVVCRGTADVARDFNGRDDSGSYWNICGWNTYQSMSVLGHQVWWVGSSHECLAQATHGGWRRFWATTGARPCGDFPCGAT